MDIDGEEVIFHIFDTAGKVCPIVCEEPQSVDVIVGTGHWTDSGFFSGGGAALRNGFNLVSCFFFFLRILIIF